MNITLADTIQKGINNPDCAFFVGQTVGNMNFFRIIIALAILTFIIKAIDKLAFSPFITWIKSKLYKKEAEK